MHDVSVLLIVYALALGYTIAASVWLAPIADLSRRDPRERAGFAIVFGVLVLAVLNNYLSPLAGPRAARIVIVALPAATLILFLARARNWRGSLWQAAATLRRLWPSAAVCAVFVLVPLHKLFIGRLLARAGILYPDLPWHIGRVASLAYDRLPFAVSPIAFPDPLPFQSFVADALAAATFRYLPFSAHALNYAQVIFVWAMVLWTAVVLVAAADAVTSLVVLVVMIFGAPLLAWGFGLFGTILLVFFHANPNSLIAMPIALVLVFHLLQSWHRRQPPSAWLLALLPAASLFFKANLAVSFAFLQAAGFLLWWWSPNQSRIGGALVAAGVAWLIAVVVARSSGTWVAGPGLQPSMANVWAYIDATGILQGHSLRELAALCVRLLAIVAAGCGALAWMRTRYLKDARPSIGSEMLIPVGVLAVAMAYVFAGWWAVAPLRLGNAVPGEPMNVNFELLVWLIGAPIAIAACRLYDVAPRAMRITIGTAALMCAAAGAWVLNAAPLEHGGLALSRDYDVTLETKLRETLALRIPGGHCFDYDRRAVLYSDPEGAFPPDFSIAATGCSQLNGQRWRGLLGDNDPDSLRQMPFIDVRGTPYRVLDVVTCTDKPPSPLQVTADVRGRTVALSWMRVAGAMLYRIEAGSKPGLRDLATLRTEGDANELVVPDVPPGRYFVRVRAKNQCDYGYASEEIRVVVP